MKKIVVMILACLMAVSMCACSQIDTADAVTGATLAGTITNPTNCFEGCNYTVEQDGYYLIVTVDDWDNIQFAHFVGDCSLDECGMYQRHITVGDEEELALEKYTHYYRYDVEAQIAKVYGTVVCGATVHTTFEDPTLGQKEDRGTTTRSCKYNLNDDGSITFYICVGNFKDGTLKMQNVEFKNN